MLSTALPRTVIPRGVNSVRLLQDRVIIVATASVPIAVAVAACALVFTTSPPERVALVLLAQVTVLVAILATRVLVLAHAAAFAAVDWSPPTGRRYDVGHVSLLDELHELAAAHPVKRAA